MAVGEKFHKVREDVYKGEDPGTKLTNHSVTIDGFSVDKSTGTGVFKILNSFGKDWGVDGYGLVYIDPTLRQGVGNLYSNPMYPIIYENISPLDRLLMKCGNFYSLSHSGLPIPFRHRTRDGLQPHFHPVIMQSACRELGGVPQEVQVDCDVQEKRIEIANNNGEKLVGTLHETGSVRIVILCHDFPSTKESNTMVNLAVALGKEGTTAFRFDFSGNGESNGCFQYGDYWRQAEDLRAVVEHFNRGRRVTSAIVGHGKGGNVALLYASKYHDISTVVNVSGCYDLRRHIDECMGEDFYDLIEKDTYFDVKSETGYQPH
ncbi:hypothetical protein RHMOL_Rhmol12G0006700 [Rhododendron molle]|uniref:Uncharacterized protein n=1 Tax=Rhododendron molle TaxID=49168 RepID=A0ACC0LDB5_RHOML|nr:hypothetical protein RHMOL_Rhmol12G0006700 [Rhododendron molle]